VTLVDQEPSVQLRRTVPTQRSAIAFARGERTGVLMSRTPSS
jgi:hypothetical protein